MRRVRSALRGVGALGECGRVWTCRVTNAVVGLGDRAACSHKPSKDYSNPSVLSDNSYYTARTSGTTTCRLPSPPDITITTNGQPSLRRKTSPTATSLRELRLNHSRLSLIRSKQSEEELQRAYESQIIAYLDGNYASLDRVEE